MDKLPITLAIDTSCDETSASVVCGLEVLSNIQPSQIEFHTKYGGVVPSIARLAHQERINGVCELALEKSGLTYEELDAIAVTIGPGLAIALEVGIRKAKVLAEKFKKPLIVVNHMEGHLFSCFAESKESRIQNSESRKNKNDESKFKRLLSPDKNYPSLGILVSGKHTEIVEIAKFGDYKILGETLDDACGEAYDKCGRLLGLGYPAGPVVARFAKETRKDFKFEKVNRNQSTILIGTNSQTGQVYELPLSMMHSKDYNFSYSGLKTAFKHLVESKSKEKDLTKTQIYDLCTIFEEAALLPIIIKLKQILKRKEYKEIWLGGGVAANSRLRFLIKKALREGDHKIEFRAPYSKKLTTDNAAMIGVVANLKLAYASVMPLNDQVKRGILHSNFEKVDRIPGLRLDENIQG